jgi:hypothetical protein
MRRTVILIAGICGLLLTLNIDVSWLIGLSALTLLVASGLSLIFRAKAPKDVLAMLLVLVFGPYVVAMLARSLLGEFMANLPGAPSSLSAILVLLVLMTISFLYVRHRILGRRRSDKQLHTNERQPLLPAGKEEAEPIPDNERD